MSTTPVLETVPDVIHALGGNKSVRTLTKQRSDQVVSAWASRGRIPPKYYVFMQRELRDRGKLAAPSLWGMYGVN